MTSGSWYMRMMMWFVVAVTSLIAGFYLFVIAASESGEVVTLTTLDNEQQVRTRLWIVDHDGAEWVRTGHAEKGWYVRVLANSQVFVERDEKRTPRVAVPVEDTSTKVEVNAAFQAKYGIADKIVALSGDASKRIPVRLDPVTEKGEI